MGIMDRLARVTGRFQQVQDLATVVSFSSVDSSYVVTYRGANVGPVWSTGGVLYAVGTVVTVIVQNGVIQGIVP